MGGKKQVAISTHQTYIKPLGRTAVASRFGFFFFFSFFFSTEAAEQSLSWISEQNLDMQMSSKGSVIEKGCHIASKRTL